MSATYKGKEMLSREEAVKAWKEMHIEHKTSTAICFKLHISESTLFRSFRRWGLGKTRYK